MSFVPEIKSDSNTSSITVITPKCQIAKIRSFLNQELTTAQNIRNRVNRQSVISALTSLSSKVSQMREIPDTGIAMYANSLI